MFLFISKNFYNYLKLTLKYIYAASIKLLNLNIYYFIKFEYLLQKNILSIRKYKRRIHQDMKFASMCGFIKLFVSTGCDTLEQAQKEDDTNPDYYLPSLGQLFSVYNDSQRQHTANHKDS